MKKNFLKIFALVLVAALCCVGLYFLLSKENMSKFNGKYKLTLAEINYKNDTGILYDSKSNNDTSANITISVDKNGKGNADVVVIMKDEDISGKFDLQVAKKSDDKNEITIPDQTVVFSSGHSNQVIKISYLTFDLDISNNVKNNLHFENNDGTNYLVWKADTDDGVKYTFRFEKVS